MPISNILGFFLIFVKVALELGTLSKIHVINKILANIQKKIIIKHKSKVQYVFRQFNQLGFLIKQNQEIYLLKSLQNK